MSENQTATEPLLTVAEVGEWLKLTPSTIRRLVETGQLPAVRLGSTTLRFNRDEMLAALAAKPVRVEENESP